MSKHFPATAVILTLACSSMGQQYGIEGRLQVEAKTRSEAPETNGLSYRVEVVGPQYNIKIWPTQDRKTYFEYARVDSN
jgi:hypothetical protein